MAALLMLVRKMARNRGLVACLMIGKLLASSLAGSLPTYESAILKRMLLRELDRYYAGSAAYPGNIHISAGFQSIDPARHAETAGQIDRYVGGALDAAGMTQALPHIRERQTVAFEFEPAPGSLANPETKRRASIAARSGLPEHVRLVDGRLPSAQPVDGVYEALVTDSALVELNMVLGHEFVSSGDGLAEPVYIRPVGVIEEEGLQQLYWNQETLKRYYSAFIVDDQLFTDEILGKSRVRLSAVRWLAAYDYRAFDTNTTMELMALKQRLAQQLRAQFGHHAAVAVPAEGAMAGYKEREATLHALLLSLYVPLYVLIGLYLYMVSSLLVERQRPEMAVLRSRGASRLQLAGMLAAESALLAVLACAAGPFIGLALTAVLGSTDAFLGFVGRASLHVELTPASFAYAAVAAAGALLINMIPAARASRVSIVAQKRKAARGEKRVWWQKTGADVVLLAISLYGLHSFNSRTRDLLATGLDHRDLAVDPLLFAVPSLFIFGCGLLLLRVYPWVVALIYRLGRAYWPAELYASLLLVSRRTTQYHALMLFLILTVGTGLFHASAARTLNDNLDNQIRYGGGADIVLRQQWRDDAPPLAPGAPPPDKINYVEPPFELYGKVEGVRHAARVFVKDGAEAAGGTNRSPVRLMGIDTDDFGRSSWMKDGLLPNHFYSYLNLIAPDPHAVLISRSLADSGGYRSGDTLNLSWRGTGQLAVTVYGVIDYFPAFNPNPGEGEGAGAPMLVVGHLDTVQQWLALEPYEVWIKLESSDAREAFYASLPANGIFVHSLHDTFEKLAESRNDPFRMAMNGVMTLSFIVSLSISFVGFLLYWTLSLQGRTQQLGVYRAMGMSFGKLLRMLALEQALTSLAGFAIGLVAGGLAGLLFVPLFQLAFDPGKIVPPFETIIHDGDIGLLLAATGLMLATALGVLSRLPRRIKLHQAIKLGED